MHLLCAPLDVLEKQVLGRGAAGTVFKVSNLIPKKGKTKSRPCLFLIRSVFLQHSAHFIPSLIASWDARSWAGGKAFDRSSGVFFAAKRLDFSAMDVPQMNVLAKEIKMLKDLRHPNIVSYRGYDLVPSDAHLFIFMDFCERDLRALMQSVGGLSVVLIRRYTRQICAGLAYLHGANVLHCDIKAANVLLTQTGEAKVADFGLAKIYQDAGSLSIAGFQSGVSSVVGSPYWMAPEVIRGQGSSTKSDVWSLGVTVVEMASTKPPLAHLDSMAALFHIGNGGDMGAPPEILGEHGKAFVTRCMDNARDRRPSCDELMQHPFLSNDDTVPGPV